MKELQKQAELHNCVLKYRIEYDGRLFYSIYPNNNNPGLSGSSIIPSDSKEVILKFLNNHKGSI